MGKEIKEYIKESKIVKEGLSEKNSLLKNKKGDLL